MRATSFLLATVVAMVVVGLGPVYSVGSSAWGQMMPPMPSEDAPAVTDSGGLETQAAAPIVNAKVFRPSSRRNWQSGGAKSQLPLPPVPKASRVVPTSYQEQEEEQPVDSPFADDEPTPAAADAEPTTEPLAVPFLETWQAGGLGKSACESKCAAKCCADPCCMPSWTVYAELLHLQPRDAEVAYGVAIDGNIVPLPGNPPVQVSPVGVADPTDHSGFRFGFSAPWDECSWIEARFTHFESSTSDAISTQPTNVMRSLVSHPSTTSAATDFLSAQAVNGVDFERIDLDFKGLLFCGPQYAVTYLFGAGYGHLDQDFYSAFVDNGTEEVMTRIRFDGGGLRIGLEGERHSSFHRFMLYSRGTATFLAGDFSASYHQGQSFDSTVVDTQWKAGRVVSILDFEAGVGWTCCEGQLRITAGYLFSAWLNTVNTDEWIDAVQANNFTALNDKMTFDGFVLRSELRF